MQLFVLQNRSNENPSKFGKPLQTPSKIQQTVQKPGERLREKENLFILWRSLFKFILAANMQRETEILYFRAFTEKNVYCIQINIIYFKYIISLYIRKYITSSSQTLYLIEYILNFK